MSNLFSSRSGVAAAFARPRAVMAALLVALAMVLTIAPVSESAARLGSGFSFGNRGTRTFSAPPSTATAPRPSAMPGSPGFSQNSFGQRPGGFFSGGGFGRGLLGGLVGAGLFGMLFGNGFGGGLGGGASLIGLVLQLGLLYLAFRWIMGYFRGQRPAMGGAGFGQPAFRTNASGFGGGAPAPATVPIQISPADFAAFEQRLTETQAAYSAGDMGALQRLATPEMANHFAGELAGNSQQGIANTLSNVKLLQGDLSEAWREGMTDYATVAMRFSLIDAMIEKATGRVVGGNATTPQVVTEIWTFARPSGASPSGWVLSAIQQA